MGTVWVFKPTDHYRFDQLCMSRMVERFGRDDTNWIQVELDFISQYEVTAIFLAYKTYHSFSKQLTSGINIYNNKVPKFVTS